MKQLRALVYCFLLFKSIVEVVLAQDSTSKQSLKSEFSTDFYGVSTQMPFWMRANQYDVVPQKTAISFLGGVEYQATLSKKTDKWKFVAGTQVVANLLDNRGKGIFLPEAYAGIRFGSWLLYVGRKKEQFGLADTTLTSGSFSWSGNALPMPKIQISTIDYLPIGKNRPWIAFKGTYAHGWFGRSEFAYDYYLHQKSLYIRLGRKSSVIKLYGGFNHHVQWGGKTTIDIGTVINRTLPSSFGDYLQAVIGFGPNIGIRSKGNPFDSTNRVGNHLGTLDVGLELDFKKYNLLFYRQSIYEDGSLFYLTNITDGLNGVALTNSFPNREKGTISIKKVVFEVLDTRSQGGEEFIIAVNQKRGRDEYFNHQQYYDGWSYRRRIIGTPFITNQFDTNRPEPQNTNDIANNNRVLVYHLGFEGYIGTKIQYLSKLSYSANYGSYSFPYPTTPKQFSGLFQLRGQISQARNIEWNAALALDQGNLYQDSFGIRVGVRKVWSYNK